MSSPEDVQVGLEVQPVFSNHMEVNEMTRQREFSEQVFLSVL